MFEIRLANNQAELDALYRFRYAIYVEEMQRTQHDADHENKAIKDALDDNAYNLLAFRSGELVGAARISLNTQISAFYADFYKIANQPNVTSSNVSIITKLMFAKEFRKSVLVQKMFMACYEFGLWRDIRFNFIDCNDHLVALFKSVGCKHYIGKAIHKEYGEVNPLILDLHDEALFRQINSPFLKPYLEWKNADLNTPST